MNKAIKLLLGVTITSAAMAGTSWTTPANAASAVKSGMSAVQSAPQDNPYEVAGIKNPKEFHKFFFKLQQAVAKNDKKTVASLVSYPLNVNTNGKTYKFRTPERFIAKYDSIMTPEIKRTLAYALEDELFANWQGVMLGDGQMWFGVLNGKLSVYAINK